MRIDHTNVIRDLTLYNAFTNEDYIGFNNEILIDVKGLGVSYTHTGLSKQVKYPDIELTLLYDSNDLNGTLDVYARFHIFKSRLERPGPFYDYFKLKHTYQNTERLCDVKFKSIEAGEREVGGLLRVKVVFERISGFYKQFEVFRSFSQVQYQDYQAVVGPGALEWASHMLRFTYDIQINGSNADMETIVKNLNKLSIETYYSVGYDDGETYASRSISVQQYFKAITSFVTGQEDIKFYLSNKNKQAFIRSNRILSGSLKEMKQTNVYPYMLDQIFFDYIKDLNHDLELKYATQGIWVYLTGFNNLNTDELTCRFTIYIWE